MNKKLIFFLIFPLMFYFSGIHAESFQFDKDLYFGMKNEQDITNLQRFLTDKGFYSGPITGNFFSLTKEAVRKYQAANNIEPAAGYFGPKTRELANASAGLSSGSVLEKQIADLLKLIKNLQDQLASAAVAEQASTTQPIATTTTEAIVVTTTPEVLLPNPFNSTLKIDTVYTSSTLSRYREVILTAVTLTAQEKIAITKIRFTNTGTLTDYYFTDLRLIEHDTNTVIANASEVKGGVLDFVMSADNSKADKGLMVSGKTYDVMATLLTPGGGGTKPFIQLDISTSTDISAFDYDDLARVAKITSNNTFPISGPRISTY